MSGVTVALGTPNPRQREFLQCRKKYVAFGGARGGFNFQSERPSHVA